MESSRPEPWSGVPFPSPRDLPNPGIEPRSPTLQADYQLSHKASPRTLEWVAYPFSSGSSQREMVKASGFASGVSSDV